MRSRIAVSQRIRMAVVQTGALVQIRPGRAVSKRKRKVYIVLGASMQNRSCLT